MLNTFTLFISHVHSWSRMQHFPQIISWISKQVTNNTLIQKFYYSFNNALVARNPFLSITRSTKLCHQVKTYLKSTKSFHSLKTLDYTKSKSQLIVKIRMWYSLSYSFSFTPCGSVSSISSSAQYSRILYYSKSFWHILSIISHIFNLVYSCHPKYKHTHTNIHVIQPLPLNL